MAMRTAACSAACAALLILPACTAHLFSSVDVVDRSRPVVRIETRGGTEFGAATELGILFLGRTATEGPCRIHYWLGPDPVTTDGTIEHAGGILYRVHVDFRQQAVDLWPGILAPGEDLVAMLPAGDDVATWPVSVSDDPIATGAVLESENADLPPGTGIFKQDENERLFFVGLVAAKATWEDAEGRQRDYLVFAGPEQVSTLLAVPVPTVPRTKVRYLPDGTWTREPVPAEPSSGPASSDR